MGFRSPHGQTGGCRLALGRQILYRWRPAVRRCKPLKPAAGKQPVPTAGEAPQVRFRTGKGQAPGTDAGRFGFGAEDSAAGWAARVRSPERVLGIAGFFLAAFFLADFPVGFFLVTLAGAFLAAFRIVDFAAVLRVDFFLEIRFLLVLLRALFFFAIRTSCISVTSFNAGPRPLCSLHPDTKRPGRA